MLDRRLQLLIDEGRHERLTSESRRTGTPVGELVRRAIDREYPRDLDDLAAAARYILDSPRPSGREPDWEETKQALLDDLYGLPDV